MPLSAAKNNPDQRSPKKVFRTSMHRQSVLSRTIQSTVPWLPHNNGILPTHMGCHFPPHSAEVGINCRQVKRAEKSVMEDTYFLLQYNNGVIGKMKAETTDSVCVHIYTYTQCMCAFMCTYTHTHELAHGG